MRIKLDENLPADLAAVLRSMGHDVDTVPEENLSGADDGAVWQATQAEERFLITQDLDFSNAQQFEPGTHHGLLLLRLHNPTRRQLIRKVMTLFVNEAVSQWSACLVVVTERKIRIKAPA